jgi:protein-S-isoprenylcysteine O-methyltransferase Ste14
VQRLARPAGIVAGSAIGAAALVAYGSKRLCILAGGVILLTGLALLGLASRQLGGAFTASFRPRATHLVTSGLYSRIPHPMYVFMGMALLGGVIMLHTPWLVLVWVAFTLEAAWHARRESKVLEGAFGEAYQEYRARTWW